MDKFDDIIEGIKNNIETIISKPQELPKYMSVKQLKMIIDELDKMNRVRDANLFVPFYLKGITDSWDSEDSLGNSLLDAFDVYKKF